MFDVKPITSRRSLDCGATCLQMLLNYYDKDVQLIDLLNDCNTRLIGCTAGDICRAGKRYDLDMKAYEMSADELVIQDRPAIIWWKYNHFCVFCGIDESGNVMICNPDKGRYRMSLGAFKTLYTGIAIFNGEPQDL